MTMVALYAWLFCCGISMQAAKAQSQNASGSCSRRSRQCWSCFSHGRAAFNQVVGRLMFLEWAYTLTFTERLDLHFKDVGWRGGMARWLRYIFDTFLPGHNS